MPFKRISINNGCYQPLETSKKGLAGGGGRRNFSHPHRLRSADEVGGFVLMRDE